MYFTVWNTFLHGTSHVLLAGGMGGEQKKSAASPNNIRSLPRPGPSNPSRQSL